MKVEEFPEFMSYIGGISEVYKNDLSEVALKFYWECLKDYAIEQIKTAIKKHATEALNGEFMPKPKDIIAQIEGEDFDKNDVLEFRASLAWGLVMDAVCSSAGLIEFEDKVIHAVIRDTGGLHVIGHSDQKSLSYLKHQFEKSYVQYAKRGVGDVPAKLSHSPYSSKTSFIQNPKSYPALPDLSCNESGYMSAHKAIKRAVN